MKFHFPFRGASSVPSSFSISVTWRASVKRAVMNVAALMVWAAMAIASDSAPLKLVGSVDLPKYSGDFDHFAADVSGNRLFLAAEDHGTLEVFDLNTTKWLKTIKGDRKS